MNPGVAAYTRVCTTGALTSGQAAGVAVVIDMPGTPKTCSCSAVCLVVNSRPEGDSKLQMSHNAVSSSWLDRRCSHDDSAQSHLTSSNKASVSEQTRFVSSLACTWCNATSLCRRSSLLDPSRHSLSRPVHKNIAKQACRSGREAVPWRRGSKRNPSVSRTAPAMST